MFSWLYEKLKPSWKLRRNSSSAAVEENLESMTLSSVNNVSERYFVSRGDPEEVLSCENVLEAAFDTFERLHGRPYSASKDYLGLEYFFNAETSEFKLGKYMEEGDYSIAQTVDPTGRFIGQPLVSRVALNSSGELGAVNRFAGDDVSLDGSLLVDIVTPLVKKYNQ